MNFETLPDEVLKEFLMLKEAEARLIIRDEAQDKFVPLDHQDYDNFIEG